MTTTAFEQAVFAPVKPRRVRRRSYSTLGQALVDRYEPSRDDMKYAAAVMVKVSLRPATDYTLLLEALGIIPPVSGKRVNA